MTTPNRRLGGNAQRESALARLRHAPSVRAHSLGFTMVELVIAVGLASMLMVAVVSLLDSSLKLWSQGEVKRKLVEQSVGTGEILARDIRMLHPGAQGDLLCEWVAFDADGDGLRERYWPRLRLVRQASAAEIAKLEASPADLLVPDFESDSRALARKQKESDSTEADKDAQETRFADSEQLTRPPASPGLIEVVWCILPDGKRADVRETGVLWRGERVLAQEDSGSFFAPGYFSGSGRPPTDELQVVTGGLLWCGVAFATQTTRMAQGWEIGPALDDASGSWDAWGVVRPDSEIHVWNEPGAGMPAPQATPLLPRRVRFEFEFEGEGERRRRTRVSAKFDAVASGFEVLNGRNLPKKGSHILVGAEWMLVRAVRDDQVTVLRAQRGTAPVNHEVGEMVHHGVAVVTEVPVRVHVGVWQY